MEDEFDIDELRAFADSLRAEAQRCKFIGDAARSTELARIATEADVLIATLLREESEATDQEPELGRLTG
jgi:hypothetical protein